ncbi:hypothetical protein F4778DRAFT_787174 [Xylariomycetidae sp. FL2044]|nr:hypothetical protein F4778DRAFT_787174 [Xylariomycetidae sp. FL2044]
MASAETGNRFEFPWGCSVPIDDLTGFPTSATITHRDPTCECPGPDAEGVLWVILGQACALHESNIVEYRVPIVNLIAQCAARDVDLELAMGVQDLAPYRDRVEWRDGVWVEYISRGFTDEEMEELRRVPRGFQNCEWFI